MNYLSSNQIRKLWCDFFANHDHFILPSQSLIPKNDPSLLLINSGVATLKDYFSNKKIPPYPNLVNSQKCIRTNDIENVGVTARHLTFFEMLGSFSIGGYFKERAIQLAYQFIFEILKLEKSKIYITYHENDGVTYHEWLKCGVDANHLIRGNDKTNFWDVGKGPCGYDTEIFYDRGEMFDPQNHGLKLLEQDIDNDRYLEIWNIVFSEFNNDGHNNYQELKLKNIDTGAGLERISSIFQQGITNFDTDLFLPIIDAVEKMSPFSYQGNQYQIQDLKQLEINKHFRIIADHMRAMTMAIQDGVNPSNTLRGYVIRKLIRRAYRAGVKLQIKTITFLHKLVEVVSQTLPVYPVDVEKVSAIIEKEEVIFSKTIKQGEELLLKTIHHQQLIDSQIAFKLFETYGYPLDLTIEIAKEHNVKLDLSQFDKLKEEHARISRRNIHNGMDMQLQITQNVADAVGQFIGYDKLTSRSKMLYGGFENNQYYSLFDKTPFYATSGGQLHDKGTIDDIAVVDVFKDRYGNHWHVTKQALQSQPQHHLVVDRNNRQKAMRNHSATHLLGSAIYQVLGYTTQLGSENNAAKLRLDFPAKSRPSEMEIKQIENKVNEFINMRIPREYITTTKKDAIEMGAWILEKEAVESTYDQLVRVVKFGNISIELCGGTHVTNTSDIEAFKIIKFDTKGSGTYRIEAITSHQAIKDYECQEMNKYREILKNLVRKNQTLKSNYKFKIGDDLPTIKSQLDLVKEDYKKILKETKSSVDITKLDVQWSNYQKMSAYINLHLSTGSEIKQLAIQLRDKYPQNLIILGAINHDKHTLVVASKTFNANQILQKILKHHNGKGGGSAVLAMGVCNIIDKLV